MGIWHENIEAMPFYCPLKTGKCIDEDGPVKLRTTKRSHLYYLYRKYFSHNWVISESETLKTFTIQMYIFAKAIDFVGRIAKQFRLMDWWCQSVRLSVRPSVCLSVRPSTFWLTFAFKFILGHINQYRLDTLYGNRPWWDLLNCNFSLWPWPSLFLFKVT